MFKNRNDRCLPLGTAIAATDATDADRAVDRAVHRMMVRIMAQIWQ